MYQDTLYIKYERKIEFKKREVSEKFIFCCNVCIYCVYGRCDSRGKRY